MKTKKPNKNSELVRDKKSPTNNNDLKAPKEIGGRKDGLDPTRYGDWEKNGRCIDF
jgi:hypothetical protein